MRTPESRGSYTNKNQLFPIFTFYNPKEKNKQSLDKIYRVTTGKGHNSTE